MAKKDVAAPKKAAKESMTTRLLQAIDEQPQAKNETGFAFINRVCLAMTDMADSDFVDLDADIKAWGEQAIQLMNEGSYDDVPDLDGVEASDGAPETNGEADPDEPDPDEVDPDDDPAPIPVKAAKPKRVAAPVEEEVDPDDDPPVVVKKAKKATKVAKVVEEEPDPDDAPAPAKARKAKAVAPVDPDDDPPVVVKKAKKAAAVVEAADPDDDPAPAKRGRKPKVVAEAEDEPKPAKKPKKADAEPKAPKAPKPPKEPRGVSGSARIRQIICENQDATLEQIKKLARKEGIEIDDTQIGRMWAQTKPVLEYLKLKGMLAED